MNDNIAFRFVTRTLSEDYRVLYSDGGTLRRLDDNSEFAPVREKGDIIPEEGPCAVLYQENGKIFLAVSGLSRGCNDRAGRLIRFSFCRIYQNAHEDAHKAAGAFVKIILGWTEAEGLISEDRLPPLLKVTPAVRTITIDGKQKNIHGEDIEFDEAAFLNWLESSPLDLAVKLKPCRSGQWKPYDLIPACQIPAEGFVFRWTKSGGAVVCTKALSREKGRDKLLEAAAGIAERLAQGAGVLREKVKLLGEAARPRKTAE